MRILIVSDKMRKSKVLWRALRRARYSADWVSTPQDALDYLDITCYDLLVLDLGLALGAGLEVLRTLRERRSSILILGLSSHGGALHARLDALRLGADDCLSFPFFTAEFLARVQALLRRERTYRPDLLTLEDLTLDRGARELSRGDQVVQLNRREFQLMELLMLHPGCLFSPQQLQDRVWEWDREITLASVRASLCKLRRKLQGLDSRMKLLTITKMGYTLRLTPRGSLPACLMDRSGLAFSPPEGSVEP